MLSFPHLVVLFVIALIIFGPQKLPELARMLGKATAEFRKMTNDFRYALEDEVREMERQARIRDEEIATAKRAAEVPTPLPAATSTAHDAAPAAAPEGAVPREAPNAIGTPSGDAPVSSAPSGEPGHDSGDSDQADFHLPSQSSGSSDAPVTISHENPSNDSPAV